MTEEAKIEKTPKRKTGRSPAYPAISVKRAIEQADALFKQEGEYEAPISSTIGAWGYSEKSSGGRQTLATMKYYGLIDVSGDGAGRMVKISDLAKHILLDEREDDTEKRQLIRDVALNPAAHSALYEKYRNGLASDGSVEHFLVFEEGFKSAAAKDLLAEFKVTADYVGLYQPDNKLDKTDDSDIGNGVKKETPTVKTGDKIQATVQDVDLFADGAIVQGISEDGEYVFVDQSDSGVPIEDVTIMETAQFETSPTPPAKPMNLLAAQSPRADAPLPEGTRKAMFPLDEGDVTLTFPVGLAEDSLEDLEAYLQIFLKKEIKKSKAPKDETEN